jgi:A/G-specific adenine glycosylase
MGVAAPILDGNVKRVFCRFHEIDSWSGDSKTQQRLWQIAQCYIDALPAKQSGKFNQSLMDLGANICKRTKPLCQLCPLAPACGAYQHQSQSLYPKAKPKKTIPEKHVVMLLLQSTDGSILLEQRPPLGIWGGLWSLPEFENEAAACHFAKPFIKSGKATNKLHRLDTLKHSFSHFTLHIQPLLCHIQQEPATISQRQTLWYASHPGSKAPSIGLAAPVKKLIAQVSNT